MRVTVKNAGRHILRWILRHFRQTENPLGNLYSEDIPMAAGLVDSEIFRDMFATAEMREQFDDRRLVGHYLRIEGALARVQGRLGIIPVSAAAEIDAQVGSLAIDFDQLRQDTTNVGYPIVGLVRQIVRACRDGAGQYVHWGATTQDIMDTAVVLQIRGALELIEAKLAEVGAALEVLATRHRDTPMAGRTHLQHALPITFGYKCAVWLSGIKRHQQRVKELRPRVLVGQFAGAAGTLASLGDQGLRVQADLMRELDLGCPEITWHVARDSLAEAVSLLGLITGSLGKIAYDVMLLMMNEVGKVAEPYAEGRGSSSTMPQKHNPICCEMILACGKIVRQNVVLMLDSMVQDLERATGPWHVEWHALPQSFIMTDATLQHAIFLLQGLQVDTVRMRGNLELTGGLIVAEAVMMALGTIVGRQTAYKIVYDSCRLARERGQSLREVLAGNPIIQSKLSETRLRELLDVEQYVGLAPVMVDRVVQKGPRAATARPPSDNPENRNPS